MAVGAFLIGMMLGETEFRHQVEATIRPFRDVLLGLFFVSIGMLFDPSLIPEIWLPALTSGIALLAVKIILVAAILRLANIEKRTSVRVGLLLAVGGEFGFALLAIALKAGVIAPDVSQIVLMAVLVSMIGAPFLIRYQEFLTDFLSASASFPQSNPRAAEQGRDPLIDHVMICGFGRIVQSMGRFLEIEKIPYIALDLDTARVREARIAAQPVHYADSSDQDVLETVGIKTARLVVISHDDLTSALNSLHHIRYLSPDLPVMVRARDESTVEELRKAGATEVVPESLEVAIMIASHALILLEVPIIRVVRSIRDQRTNRYRLLREFFRSGDEYDNEKHESSLDRLRPVILTNGCRAIGNPLGALEFDKVVVTALVRKGFRTLSPSLETILESGDVVVLFGSPEDLEKAESQFLS